jgi:hypothetical protein
MVTATCWVSGDQGAKFWMQVLSELKHRGISDILTCCVDGLKGFPEAIEAVFPATTAQTCIVHLIRNSLKYVPRREFADVARDLRPIYTAIDADSAHQELERFDEKWGARFPVITQAWLDSWEYVTPFLAFPPEGEARDCQRGVSVFGHVGASYVLVAERGWLREGVARRQGCRRNQARTSDLSIGGVPDPRRAATPFAAGCEVALGFGVGVVDPEQSAGSGTDACRAACPAEGPFQSRPIGGDHALLRRPVGLPVSDLLANLHFPARADACKERPQRTRGARGGKRRFDEHPAVGRR